MCGDEELPAPLLKVVPEFAKGGSLERREGQQGEKSLLGVALQVSGSSFLEKSCCPSSSQRDVCVQHQISVTLSLSLSATNKDKSHGNNKEGLGPVPPQIHLWLIKAIHQALLVEIFK